MRGTPARRDAAPLPAHPAADARAAQLGLGPLEAVHSQRVDWSWLIGPPLLMAAIGALIGWFSDGGWLMPAVALGFVGIVAGLAFVVWQLVNTRRGLQVRRYRHGMVLLDGDRIVSGRWNELRLSEFEFPRRARSWRVVAPDGVFQVSDNTWTDIDDALRPVLGARRAQLDQARATIARGEPWNFSGWVLTREGIRTPRRQGLWGSVELRTARRTQGFDGHRDSVQLFAGGVLVDVLEVDDTDLLADILGPFVRLNGF
ncbi:hypothetical protein GCM10027418_25940 [Mariniluteicoccus endophyticus]